MKTKVVLEGVFRPEDAKRQPYQLVPFHVPEGIQTVEVRYSYDKHGNVIDIGLFDPRGNEFITASGFRGWSGSAKEQIIVSERWATPGYLPGPIYSGVWQVLLGLYQIVSSCHWEVEIVLSTDAFEEPRCPIVPALSSVSPGWLRGDLHCHTLHSDAEITVFEVWEKALKKGLNFLSVTDHNTISHFQDIKELNRTGALLIPGEEITTYLGHANVWGLWDWIDFRCTNNEEILKVCEVVHAKGGIFSINHPKDGGPAWEFTFDIEADCLEVWHGFWSLRNEESLGRWFELLSRGRRVVAVGGSDAHPRRARCLSVLEWIGNPTTWVYVDHPSVEDLVLGIKRGHVSISSCPHGSFLEILFVHGNEKYRQGETVPYTEGKLEVYVSKGRGMLLQLFSSRGFIGAYKVPSAEWRALWEVNLLQEGYIGAMLSLPLPEGRAEMAALANPLWCERWLEAMKEKTWKK